MCLTDTNSHFARRQQPHQRDGNLWTAGLDTQSLDHTRANQNAGCNTAIYKKICICIYPNFVKLELNHVTLTVSLMLGHCTLN